MIQARKAVTRKAIPTVFLVATLIAVMIGASGSSVVEASCLAKGYLNDGLGNND